MTSAVARCPLVARVRHSVLAHPRAIAHTDGTTTMSYTELWDRVETWRGRLASLRAPARTAVAVLSDGSADLAAQFLGIRAANLVPVLIDAYLGRERQSLMLRVARPAVIIDTRVVKDAPTATLGSDEPSALPEEAGYLAFTSGSQGSPKGIVGNAAGVEHFVDWEADLIGLRANALRVAQLTSPSFDVVLREMLLPLMFGGTLCVAGPEIRTDPHAVIDWLADQRVSVLHAVPGLSTRWVHATGRPNLPDLRWTLFAGEPLYARHVHKWRSVARAGRVVNLYGPSETTLAKFAHEVRDPPPAGLQPVGTALPGATLAADLSGSDPSAEFPIVLRTPHGSLGYLRADQRTDRHALTRDDGVTTFRTSDLGRLDDAGLLYVVGRLDGQVKRLGALVDPGRVAAEALADTDVIRAYCVQVDVEGVGDLVLAVETTPTFEMRAFTARLRRALGTAGPNQVMTFDQLPQLANGKVDRGRLIEEVDARRGAAADQAIRGRHRP